MFKLMNCYFWISQFKRDFLVDYSYKISFFSQFLGIFLTATSFFFISKTFPQSDSVHLEPFNYNYFVFAAIGIAILDIVATLMRALTTTLREAQSFGYIEILFISKINPGYLFLCSAIYPLIKGIFKFIFYIFLIQFFGSQTLMFSSIIISLLLVLIMIIPFLALSFLSLSFILYFKQSNPINFIINTLVSIFSGIIYPVTVMPVFMQNISNFIPLTIQLNSARDVLINNSLNEYIFSSLFFIHIFCSLIFLLICMYIFHFTIYIVKKKGTIGAY